MEKTEGTKLHEENDLKCEHSFFQAAKEGLKRESMPSLPTGLPLVNL